MILCDIEKCYGCFSCVNACPNQCIKMIEGDNGHIIPFIDNEKCVNCGLCEKVCPAIQQIVLNTPTNTYAAWNINKEEQAKSSSGGISALLAKKMIKEGGIVYGAAFDRQWNVNHVRCETVEDIRAICKSKYVQSWIKNNFNLIKKDLKEEKKVLFFGTPCQVAGLKSFLKKDYNNLFTVDIVCHGTPSRKVYREELEEKTKLEELQGISFRGDYGYGYGYGLGFYYRNKLESFSIRQSYFMKGFIDGLFFRNSCYQCSFACEKRVGDITLGDFWGIGKSKPFDNPDKNRVSLVLINTTCGEFLFSKIKNDIYFEERTLQEAVAGNPQLQHSMVKPKNYKKFKQLYKVYGLKKAASRVYPKMRFRLLLEKCKLLKITR